MGNTIVFFPDDAIRQYEEMQEERERQLSEMDDDILNGYGFGNMFGNLGIGGDIFSSVSSVKSGKNYNILIHPEVIKDVVGVGTGKRAVGYNIKSIIVNGTYEYMTRTMPGDYTVFAIPGTMMSDYGWKYLSNYMGKEFTAYGIKLTGGIYSYNHQTDFVHMYTSSIHCGHSSTATSSAGTIKLLALAEIGNNISGFYIDKSSALRNISGVAKDSDFAKLAYWAYYADHNSNEWQVNYLLDDKMIPVWVECAKKIGVDASICNQFGGHDQYTQQGLAAYAGKANQAYATVMRNAQLYANLVSNINGKAIEFDKSSKPMQNNDKITGVKFKNYTICNESNITIEVTLKNGQKVTSGITVLDSNGNTVNPLNIKKGETYSIKVPGASYSNPIKTLKFNESYPIYKARVAFMMAAASAEQARIITGGDKTTASDSDEIEVEQGAPSQPILVIQKNDLNGSALQGAVFNVTVKNKNNNKSKTLNGQKTNDAGQIIISSKKWLELELGDLSQENVKLEITLAETAAPDGYEKINGNIVLQMEYKAGQVTISSTNPNVNVKTNLMSYKDDEGKNAKKYVGVVTVKNKPIEEHPKENLQHINIMKVDSKTGERLSNVDFNITISKEPLTGINNGTMYKTDNAGLMTITKEELNKIIGSNYTGDLYLLMEETAPKSGYKKLSDKVFVKVTYNNGNITKTEKLGGTAECIESTKDGAKILTIKVPNERQLPDLIISKESLSNNITEIINSANLSIKVTADNGRTIPRNGQVNVGGQVIITGDELATLGINENYTGKLIVDIHESTVEPGAVVLPEDVRVTLQLQNGRYKSSTTTNEVHTSVIDNDASIEVKVLNYKQVQYMPISGIVWEELAATKARGTLIDGMYTKATDTEFSDKLFEGIEVTLYRVNNEKLEFVNVTKGTNPTFTDNKGHYEFQVPQGTSGYVVKFTYNGQIYTPAEPDKEYNALTEFSNWKLSSKASEYKGSRNAVNNLLKEIGSYPANYKMTTPLFNSSVIPTTDNLSIAYEAGYNVAYTQAELGILHREIAKEMSNLLAKTQNININTPEGLNNLKAAYARVALNNTNDPEIYNKLQYIYDTRVNAYAGYSTIANGIDSISSEKTYSYPGDTSKDYQVQQYVNLGLVKRDSTDLSLLKDVENVTLLVDGENINYDDGYGKGNSSYTEALDARDFDWSEENGNDADMDLKITYKLTAINSTNTLTKLTEIVDYYDSKFVAESVRADKIDVNGNRTPISNVTISDSSKYINASNIGLTGTNKYSQRFIKFGDEPSIVDNEKIEIFVTIKLANADDKKVAEILTNALKPNEAGDKGRLSAYNYAEINGYKTNEGLLDKDSKPGSMKVKEFEDALNAYIEAKTNKDKARYATAVKELLKIREDDAWRVEQIITVDDSKPRTITGNVWKVLNQGDNLPTFNGENGLEGIRVELIKLKDGNATVVTEVETDSNGQYTIEGFRAGEYTVRFKYNGISYQSAKANPNTDQNKYWYNVDSSTRYSDAYDDVKSRLEVIKAMEIKATNGAGEITYKDLLDNATTAGEIKNMYAYTSTIVVERDTDSIQNIDFAITPRTSGDLSISKHVSNIKVYLQDGTLQLDANIGENGEVTYSNDKIYNNIVNVFKKGNTNYLDGLIEALIDEQLLNGATLEITYAIKVENGVGNSTIKYIYSTDKGNTPVAIAYYGENYNQLPLYEGDRGEGGAIVYYDSNRYTLEKNNTTKNDSSTGKLRITELVDYIDPRLNFIQATKSGAKVNSDWEVTDNSFASSRKESEVFNRYNTIVKAKSDSAIYKTLEAGESATTSITLSTVLSTSSTDTSDWKYSNLVEITKLYSENGKVSLKGYDITESENSKPVSRDEIQDPDFRNNIYPTLGTAKSETLVIHAPTGQNNIEKILSNTVIVLIAFTVLAGGIVLIKKFVLKDKND